MPVEIRMRVGVDINTVIEDMPPHPVVRALDGIAETILVVAVLGELFAVIINVLARTILGVSFLWTEEIARIALSTLTFVGGTVAYRRGDHTYVRAVIDILPLYVHRRCVALADALVFAIAVVALLSSFKLLELNWQQTTPILGWPVSNIAVPLTASMALLAFYAASRLWREHRTSALGVTIAVLAVAVMQNALRLASVTVEVQSIALGLLLILSVVKTFGGRGSSAILPFCFRLASLLLR